MTSTKIANDGVLGGITLTVGGTLDVGGQFTTFGDPNAAKGILTTSGGNISVTAGGDVNVDGSRIAVYNGGNVLVDSQHGDVNAGAGGSGYVSMTSLELDPVTHQLISLPASIPGSGILATTLAGSIAPVLGNITVNAPNGSINASLGGIVQIAFNGANARNALINLNAGQDINASGSGVIGSNVKLQAGGNVTGIVVGSGDVAINAQHNVNVTAFGGTSVAITAVGGISGTIISGGAVNVSGDTISAALVAGSVSTSGDASKAQVGMPTSTVAKDEPVTASDATSISKQADAQSGDEKKKEERQNHRPHAESRARDGAAAAAELE